MASPNLTTECTAIPDLPIQQTNDGQVELIVFEDNTAIGRITATALINRITLKYSVQSDAQRASFKSFWESTQGVLFYWNDVRLGINDILVRWEDSKVMFLTDSIRTSSWTVKLRVVTS